jgi:hypothetical protein
VPRAIAAAFLAFAACGRSHEVQEWIGARAAVVRCSNAGRVAGAPVFTGVPAPPPPSGLLARALDPVALDELGYERETVVCASLEAPSPAVIDEAGRSLVELIDVQEAAAREALRVGGRCTCEIARALELRELIPTCVDAVTLNGCDAAQRAEVVASALAPVLAAIDRASMPWTHWRMVGRTDRPGWFVAHLGSLLAHHGGGSTAYVQGERVPARADPLLPILLEQPGVVAVVGQDGGRSVLVVRELDGLLVLDHFTQPPSTPRRLPLVARIELAQVTALVGAMARPDAPRTTLLPPTDGMLVELDVALLEEIDRAAIATAVLGGGAYVVADERREEPTRLFDRVAFQAPFGHEGLQLRVEHELSSEGRAWAQTLGAAPMLGNLDALGLDDRAPVFEPADDQLAFTLRGSATSRFAVHGVQRLPSLARALEIAAPGSLGGDLSSWSLQWPGVPLPNDEAELSAEVFAGLRALMSARPYRIAASFDAERTRLRIEARPL